MTPKPPIASIDLPEGWPELVREIVVREGRAVRGLGASPTIELKSLKTNEWYVLQLPGCGTTFVSFDDRNAVLRRINGQ